jgi:hypothetical protein
VTAQIKRPGLKPVRAKVQLATLVLLFGFILDAAASHALSVSPALPTSEDTISVLITGDWPEGGGPDIKQWTRVGKVIRIDALGVLPGIVQPIVPYQLDIDIGRLPFGRYDVDYYIEVLAAPGSSPPGVEQPVALPDASFSFEVLAGPTPIPTLSAGALTLLGALLLLLSLVVFGENFRKSRLCRPER